MKYFKDFRAVFTKKQQGFTLLEIVIAVAITGALASGITMTISQIFTSNMRDSARMTAVQDAQSGVYWLSRDVQMAQNVQPSGSTGFPLQLSWVEWETNDVYRVTYSLNDGQFLRGHSVNGGPVEEAIIASNINSDASKTNCSLTGRVLTISLTASVPYGSNTASETRVVEVLARPGS
jgi:prepilin-type N-terminal cleavage/methylation domain-containing protein